MYKESNQLYFLLKSILVITTFSFLKKKKQCHLITVVEKVQINHEREKLMSNSLHDDPRTTPILRSQDFDKVSTIDKHRTVEENRNMPESMKLGKQQQKPA